MLAVADLAAVVTMSVLVVPGVEVLWALALAPAWIVLAKLLGLYDRDHRSIRHLTIDEVPAILVWALAGAVATSAALGLTERGSLGPGSIAELAAAAGASCFLLRVAARALWRRTTPPERCAVLGDAGLSAEIRRKTELFEDMHLGIEAELDPATLRSLLEAGDRGGLAALLAGLDRVIVATSPLQPDLVGALSGVCRQRQIKLSVVSPLRGRALPTDTISQVADLPVLEFNTWDVSRTTVILKRCFDLAAGLAGLFVLALLLPAIAIAIKLDSRGPVFFTQTRAGRGGRPFRILKFRTMEVGAERSLERVVSLDALEEPAFKLSDDPRRTRAGRLLRRISLDELPQVVNVLRGEMSIVGPRPEQMELVRRYRPEHRFRLAVKPGITGPMQVHGRGMLTLSERLAVELDYIQDLSLGRDLRLLALTVPAVLRRHGAS